MAFTIQPHISVRLTGKHYVSSIHHMGSKEDEIAELETKLRELKKDAELEKQQERNEMEDTMSAVSSVLDVDDYPEMLSEQWKEDMENKDSGSNGTLANVAISILVIVGLILFSQVPIGNEGLDKYSTAAPTQSIDLGDLNPVKKVID